MFADIGIEKLLLVLGIILIFFGPRRLPELGATLGKGIRDFKRNLQGLDEPTLLPPAASAAREQTDPAPAEPKRLLS